MDVENASPYQQPTSSGIERIAGALKSQQMTTIQEEMLDNKKQLDVILDRHIYSAIEIPDKVPFVIDDVDADGNKIRRTVLRDIVRYQKLPTDIKVLDCKDIVYDPESSCQLNPYVLEYSELEEKANLLDMKKHIEEQHGVEMVKGQINKYSYYKDWNPMMNKSGLDSIKSYLLGLTSPIISTTKYDDTPEGRFQLQNRAMVDAKGGVLLVIQNHKEFEFDYEDGSRVRSLLIFLFELIDAVKKRSLGGFVYKGIVQSTNINENRIITNSGNRKGGWDKVKSSLARMNNE